MRLAFILSVVAAILVAFTGTVLSAKDSVPEGLFVKPGETFIFRLENGQPVDVHPATEGQGPEEGELSVTLSVEGGTKMTLRNQTGENLNYRAYITSKPTSKGKRTSVCTLFPGAMGIEFWPDALPGIRITDFEPASGFVGCR